MNGRKLPFLPILFMCALAAAAYGIYKNVDFEEVEYSVGYSDEARKNKFLAAGRLMESEGFTFEIGKDRGVFSELDLSSTGVLWMRDINELEDIREAEHILAWVKSGGILLTSSIGDMPFGKSTVPGWLLGQLGIKGISEEDEESDKFYASFQSGDYYLSIPDEGLTHSDFQMHSEIEPYFQIKSRLPEGSTNIIDSPYLVHNKLDKGYFTLYADYEQFDNDRISSRGRGYLLLWLIQPAKTQHITMLFRPASKPGLFTVLWGRFSLAILLLGVALIGFLRWAAARLGPVEQELPPVNNNIMAHLAARGEYWHRHKHTNKVLTNVQKATLEQITASGGLRPSGEENISQRDMAIKQVVAKLDCTPAQAEQILYGEPRNSTTLLRVTQALQRLNHRNLFKSNN